MALWTGPDSHAAPGEALKSVLAAALGAGGVSLAGAFSAPAIALAAGVGAALWWLTRPQTVPASPTAPLPGGPSALATVSETNSRAESESESAPNSQPETVLWRNSETACLKTNPSGRVIAANPAALVAFGREESELLGRHALALVQRLAAGSEERSPRFLRPLALPLSGQDPEQELLALCDVSGELSAISRLAEAQASLHLVQRCAGIGLWEYDFESDRLKLDNKAKQLLKLREKPSKRDLRRVRQLLSGADGEEEQDLASGPDAWRYDRHWIDADGNRRWFLVSSLVTRHGADAEPALRTGILADRTRISAAVSRLDMALKASRATIWEWDIEADSLSTNAMAGRLVGRAEGEEVVPFSHFVERVHPQDLRRVQEALQRSLKSDSAEYDVEFRYRHECGEYRWINSVGEVTRRSRSGKALSMVGQIRDINTQRELLEKAQAADRAKTDFLANMSHEVRTPMAAILGHIDILASTGPIDPTESREALATIRGEGEALLSMLDDLLELCSLEGGGQGYEPEAVVLRGLYEELIASAGPAASASGLAFVSHLDPALPLAIRSHGSRLSRALRCLLGNAVKFTERGEIRFEVSADAARHRLRFVIADTGIGMQAAALAAARSGAPVQQADESMTRKHGGMGIGLRLAHRIASAIGGRLELSSLPGRGTRVELSLPLVPAASQAADTSAPESKGEDRKANLQRAEENRVESGRAPEQAFQAPSKSEEPSQAQASTRPSAEAGVLTGLRVLVVEDGRVNQRLLMHHLKRAGAQVELAENGQLAVDRVAAAEAGEALPLPDLILMDMQMPVMDGYTATRTLRERGFGRPVIAVTAHALSGDRERCLEAGCDEYLTKPIDAPLLLRTCADRAGGGASPSPASPAPGP